MKMMIMMMMVVILSLSFFEFFFTKKANIAKKRDGKRIFNCACEKG